MKRANKKAIAVSEKHWRENTAVDDLGDANAGQQCCALCVLDEKRGSGCESCPIMLKTGWPQCRHTPYLTANLAYGDGDLPAFKNAATKMADFISKVGP